MKNFQTHFSILGLVALIALAGCGGDAVTFRDSLTMNFSASANGSGLVYTTQNYTTAVGNDITIDRIKMYVSNVQLINSSTGEAYIEHDGYHLISLNDQQQSHSLTVEGIRSDLIFDKIRFDIGVDEERNFSIDNVGDLDPANDMAWDWNTGYKFFLMEGNYFPGGGEATHGLVVHIGQNRNLKSQEFSLSDPINIPGAASFDFDLDALAPFAEPNAIDLAVKSTYKVDVDSDLIAQNYADGMLKLVTENN